MAWGPLASTVFYRALQDCRVMPARIFGLDLGDAEYIRNAGGTRPSW